MTQPLFPSTVGTGPGSAKFLTIKTVQNHRHCVKLVCTTPPLYKLRQCTQLLRSLRLL